MNEKSEILVIFPNAIDWTHNPRLGDTRIQRTVRDKRDGCMEYGVEDGSKILGERSWTKNLRNV